MKNKYILSVFICLVLVSCNSMHQNNLEKVKAQLKSINDYLYIHKDNAIILAKLIGKDTLIDIKRISLPDNVDTIYSLMKDTSGRVIVLGETPIRKTEDWKTVSTHYFDKDGNTLAFTNQNIFLNNTCSDKVVNELIVEYYDKSFIQIGKDYGLIDGKGNSISEKKCKLPYETSYKVYRNSDPLLKKISLPIKK